MFGMIPFSLMMQRPPAESEGISPDDVQAADGTLLTWANGTQVNWSAIND